MQRITRVEMPEGAYDLGPSTVNVTLTSEDLTGPGRTAAERDIERRMRPEADRQFGDMVARAIERMKAVERNWNDANACASIQFSPASGDRTLHLGDAGSFSGTVVAKPGGSPPTAAWTRTAEGNGTFAPAASSNPATLDYHGILEAGPDIFVTGTYRAVSKAGVAEATWKQPTESIIVNRISGTFSASRTSAAGSSSWSGEATWARQIPGTGANGAFGLTSASYTVTASGRGLNAACDQSGTKTVSLTAGDLTVRARSRPARRRTTTRARSSASAPTRSA